MTIVTMNENLTVDYALYSNKGGTGVTVTAVRLAAALGRLGMKVLLITDNLHDSANALGVTRITCDHVQVAIEHPSVCLWWRNDYFGVGAGFDVVLSDGWHHQAEQNILVTRNCYLTLAKEKRAGFKFDQVAAIIEPERALSVHDIHNVMGKPTVGLPYQASVARAVDAGILSMKADKDESLLQIAKDKILSWENTHDR